MTPGTRLWAVRAGSLFTVWAWMLAWGRVAGSANCFAAAVFLLGLWIAVTLPAYEWALVRRLGFVAQYLERPGVLARWLSRRLLLFSWQALKSLPVAVVLVMVALSLTAVQWVLLLADAMVLAVLVATLGRMLRGELGAPYVGTFARMWAHRCNALLLWAGLLVLAFYMPHADYRGLPWESAARAAALQVETTCDAIAVLARASAVIEALGWWAAQNFLGDLRGTGELLLSWLLFLASFGVSFLGAWAYSRALTGALSRPWRAGPRAMPD